MRHYLRIFLSSTFIDMEQEREQLIKDVFLRLKEFGKHRNVDITDVDLRIGVSQEELENGNTLKVCLDEVERCKESKIFFIGLLGHRYGWNAWSKDGSTNIQSLKSKYDWIFQENLVDRSITELEIECAIKKHIDLSNKRIFIYLRDEDFSNSIEAQLVKKKNYQPEPYLLKQKQIELKSKILTTSVANVSTYASIQELSEIVFEDIKNEIVNIFPDNNSLNIHEKNQLLHDVYSHNKTKIYIPDQHLIAEIWKFIQSKKQSLILHGESGIGKSSLLSYIKEKIKVESNEYIVIDYFIGADGKNKVIDVVQKITRDIQNTFLAHEENLCIINQNTGVFEEWLQKIPDDKKVLIIIDALDQISDDTTLSWIPKKIPDNVKFLLSLQQIHEKNKCFEDIKVYGVDVNQKVQIIELFEHDNSIKISEPIKTKLYDNNQTDNPLYLLIILNEIKLFGNIFELEKFVDYYLKADSVEMIFKLFFDRLRSDYQVDNNNLVNILLSYLYIFKYGIDENTFIDLISSKYGYKTSIYPILLSIKNYLSHGSRLYIINNKFKLSIEGDIGKTNIEKSRNDFIKIVQEKYRNNQFILAELAYQLYLTKDSKNLYTHILDIDTLDCCIEANEQDAFVMIDYLQERYSDILDKIFFLMKTEMCTKNVDRISNIFEFLNLYFIKEYWFIEIYNKLVDTYEELHGVNCQKCLDLKILLAETYELFYDEQNAEFEYICALNIQKQLEKNEYVEQYLKRKINTLQDQYDLPNDDNFINDRNETILEDEEFFETDEGQLIIRKKEQLQVDNKKLTKKQKKEKQEQEEVLLSSNFYIYLCPECGGTWQSISSNDVVCPHCDSYI